MFNVHVLVLGRIHLVLNKTLTDDTSVKRAQIKTFFVFYPILLKLGEVVVPMCTTQLHQVSTNLD